MTRKFGEHPTDGKGLERVSAALKADSERNQTPLASNSVVCNCADVPPTMPTFRTEHLAWCPVWLLQHSAVLQNEVKEPVTFRSSNERCGGCGLQSDVPKCSFRCLRAEREIARLTRELADTTWQDHADHWQKEARRLRAALEKAADTFADFNKGLRLLNRPLLADACEIAEKESRAALSGEPNSAPETTAVPLHWTLVHTALDDAAKALPVLFDMCAAAGLRQGAVVADEILGNVNAARKQLTHTKKLEQP